LLEANGDEVLGAEQPLYSAPLPPCPTFRNGPSRWQPGASASAPTPASAPPAPAPPAPNFQLSSEFPNLPAGEAPPRELDLPPPAPPGSPGGIALSERGDCPVCLEKGAADTRLQVRRDRRLQ